MEESSTPSASLSSEAPQQPEAVLLIRHGATDWSEAGRHTGWTDLPLNGTGLDQAQALRGPLSRWSFSAVYCSPLQRARDTCTASGYGDGVEVDPDLREWNYGDYEGRTAAEIGQLRPGWTLWDDGVVNGESLTDVAARADRVVTRLRSERGAVAVFAHGHLLRMLAARWIEQEALIGRLLYLSTASISEVGWEHDWPSIRLWNDTGHLEPGIQGTAQ
ncbi:MAG: histidine phosphatase family protein [Candidatus Dormibacteraeota bacterium]|nr:histidine phosphatase family protein [Candidatus Dormibacteraeota bacterium]